MILEFDTCTNSPTLWWNIMCNLFFFGCNFIILKSNTKDKRPSRNIISSLRSIDLDIYYNKKSDVYITTSENGWNQTYNLKEQANAIAKPQSILSLDNWFGFKDQIFIDALLDRLCLPRMC